MMPMIETRHIHFAYQNKPVLRDVDLSIQPGAFAGLIGPNGSGKTTLLKLIEGLLVPREGDVLLQGVPVRQLTRRKIAQILAVVPQDSPMVFPFSVKEVVLMGRSPHLSAWQFEKERDYAVVNEAMALTDTISLADRSMDSLSGGERQRVLIARALAQEPQVLLLDEPTTYLDIRHQVEFFDLIKRLNRKQGVTVLAVTHDINLASLYCDVVILLREGRIHLRGRPEDIITEEHIQAVYNIPVFVDRHPVIGLPRVTPKGAHSSETGSR